jgi:hypothetical protein
MQDTLSEGTARAAQLAPSAVTASAVGRSATRSVVADCLSPTTSDSSRSTRDRACSSTIVSGPRGIFGTLGRLLSVRQSEYMFMHMFMCMHMMHMHIEDRQKQV